MTQAEARVVPFEAVGGAEGVRRIVDRFYDLMDSVPAYRELRALHADNLRPMRESLAGFLTGWLGGPRDWFDAHPGKCMMSAHAPIAIDAITAEQWISAMSDAMRDVAVDQPIAGQMETAFKAMASAMIRR